MQTSGKPSEIPDRAICWFVLYSRLPPACYYYIPSSFPTILPPPPLKRRKLDIPARAQRVADRKKRQKALTDALAAIQKLIRSKRRTFDAVDHGLQATRARAIESHLLMVVHNHRTAMYASRLAAESHGFAPGWGGRMVRRWVRRWVVERELPVSWRGKHVKAFSLLEDPNIVAELRSYMRSNKWSMNPAKK